MVKNMRKIENIKKGIGRIKKVLTNHFFVSDLKRNMSILLKFIMKVMTKPKK